MAPRLFLFFLFFFLFFFFFFLEDAAGFPASRRSFPARSFPFSRFSQPCLSVYGVFYHQRRTIWRNMSKQGIHIIHPVTLLQVKAASHSPYSRRLYHYHHVQRCSLYGLASLLKHPPVLAHCHHFVTNLYRLPRLVLTSGLGMNTLTIFIFYFTFHFFNFFY